MSERWLKCRIEKGMFSDEVAILLNTQTGETVSFFVPAERVDRQQGKVRVRAFQQNSRFWVVVPNETQSMVPVDDSEFATA